MKSRARQRSERSAVSRAFVKDDDAEKEPEFRLPDADSPYYEEAAA